MCSLRSASDDSAESPLGSRRNKGVDTLYYAWGIALLVACFAVRLFLYPVISGDYTSSLSHWMDALRGSPGLGAFRSQFSDYAPLYLYFLKFLTLIPIYELFSIKTLSFIFDMAIGVIALRIIKRNGSYSYSLPQLFLIGAVILSIPTVMLNSSAWAQADSLYTAFILASLYFMLMDRPLAAAVMFGISFSFKLQAIFFLPVLLGYFLVRKKDRRYLLAVPIIFALTVIPAWLAGGSFWNLFTIYAQQSGEFPALSLSAPTVFSFLNESGLSQPFSTALSYIGVVIALGLTVWIVWGMIQTSKQHEAPCSSLIFFALISAIALPFFLPHMHERYFYLADVLSVIYAFAEPRRWYLPILVVGASFFSYMPFLSGSMPFLGRLVVNEGILGLAMLIALSSLLPELMRRSRKEPVIIP